MKAKKFIYWSSTILFCLFMLFQAYFYLNSEMMKKAFEHLGFPDYFRIELAVAKFFGAIALLLPVVKGRAKEWVYAGFSIVLLSGAFAHFSKGDPASVWMVALIVFGVLMTSYFSYHRLQGQPKEE